LGSVFAPQSSSGLSEELQVSTQDFGLRFGATPTGFPVYNWLGGSRWRIAGGPITILLSRDNVKDTIFSRAGAVDPGTGTAWGGVMSNSGTISDNWRRYGYRRVSAELRRRSSARPDSTQRSVTWQD
jgi:hypothetical protein